MAKTYKRRWMVILVLFMSCLIAVFAVFSFSNTAATRNVSSVKSALSMYFAEYNQYPDNLDILVEKYGMSRKHIRHIDYIPTRANGSYSVEYRDWRIIASVSPPSYSQMSPKAKEIELLDSLKHHFLLHGSFPENLQEFAKAYPIFLEDIEEGLFTYSASIDLKSFILNGEKFDSTLRWPSEGKLLSRASKIKILRFEIILYYKDNGRFPKNLQELVGSGHECNDSLADLTEGENIIYETSEDQKRAYLDGEEIKSWLLYLRHLW